MTEKRIQIAVELDSQDLREGHDLYAVLYSAIKSRGALPLSQAAEPRAFWDAGHFHLDRVSLFQQAGEAEQQRIVEACGRSLLGESYYIEKCGMYFSAKMSLLASHTQERMLYSMFAADEALHFNWLGNFVSPEEVKDLLRNPFIQLLEELLQQEQGATLAYIVQVILEGWGIHHYQALAKNCLDAGLKKVFERILQDEARHHASGLILFSEQQLTEAELDHLAAILVRFLRMVQSGPQMIVARIEEVKGRLTPEEKRQVFAELDCQTETAKKIATLKSLIKAAAYAEPILARLQHADAFRPFSPAECAAL
jgi:hypothetical protein